MNNDVECQRCGRVLDAGEQAWAFRDKEVCRRCYDILSQPTVVPRELAVVHSAEPLERYRSLEKKDASRHPVTTGIGDKIFRFLEFRPKWICPQCGKLQDGHRRGSGGAQAGLLLFWVLGFVTLGILIPLAVIYSIWYIAARSRRCISCDCRNCISVDSPRGQELLRKI